MGWHRAIGCALVLALATGGRAAATPASDRSVERPFCSFSFDESHLESIGLAVVAAGSVSDRSTSGERFLMFATTAAASLPLRPDGEALVVPFRGGMVFRAEDPRTREPLPPLFLLDFTLHLDLASPREPVRIMAGDPMCPLSVRHAGVRWQGPELRVRRGDLVISEAWARRLGRPRLAGLAIGGFELRLAIETAPRVPSLERVDSPRTAGSVLDITLGELYGLQSYGRVGTYPDGVSGFSASTTSCNTGDLNVPWNAAMAETHPFIGLAMFREKDGILEMIGKNWIKHGFYALSFDACSLGCAASDGTYLGVGCSDTYWVSHNANRYDLGPREEVNPYTGEWKACGSFFDADPVDCERDYFGAEPNGVNHRLEVHDSDLGLLNGDGSPARYFYEGVYITAGDQVPENDLGWRECTTIWNGAAWYVPTFPGIIPQPGPLVLSWGDGQTVATVAPDDGEVMLAWQIEDLGGTWHYEYALYNRRSDRGVHSFAVPVGGANVTSAGFHDIDQNPGNDWTIDVSGGVITWSTDDWATDPGAPYLPYQTLFNFRFDADAAPVAAQVTCGIFKPGIGSEVSLASVAPHDGVTAAPTVAAPVSGVTLDAVVPNPFASDGRIRFTLPGRRHARVTVLDVRGRAVRRLFDGTGSSGPTVVSWDGRNGLGAPVAGGMYFFRLESGDAVRTVKGTLVR